MRVSSRNDAAVAGLPHGALLTKDRIELKRSLGWPSSCVVQHVVFNLAGSNPIFI